MKSAALLMVVLLATSYAATAKPYHRHHHHTTGLARYITPTPLATVSRIPALRAKWSGPMWRRSDWPKPLQWLNPVASRHPRGRERGDVSLKRANPPHCCLVADAIWLEPNCSNS